MNSLNSLRILKKFIFIFKNVHLENGANLAKWTACVKMELLVIHLMVNAYVIEVGLVLTVIRNVLLIDMDKIVAKNVAAEMVEVVIIFLANAIVLQVIQDLCKTLYFIINFIKYQNSNFKLF